MEYQDDTELLEVCMQQAKDAIDAMHTENVRLQDSVDYLEGENARLYDKINGFERGGTIGFFNSLADREVVV